MLYTFVVTNVQVHWQIRSSGLGGDIELLYVIVLMPMKIY